jgi:3' exoribonuclease, RNase T-like
MSAIHFDCEFLENGRTIELISIGMVRESDGAEYYAVSRDAAKRRLRRRIRRHPWLMGNVVPSLPRPHGDWIMSMPDRWLFNYLDPCVKPREQIAREVADFILAVPDPELWAWYGAYDHVVLCQLWGRMIDLPPGVPMFTRDLKQECERLGGPDLPRMPGIHEHNALSDAREVAFRHRWLRENAAAPEAEPSSLKALAEAERIIAARDAEIERMRQDAVANRSELAAYRERADAEIAALRDRCDGQFAVVRGLREQEAEGKEEILALQQALGRTEAENVTLKEALAGGHLLELADLRAKVAEYENAIAWNTSCTACARTLDSSVAEHDRADRAEQALAPLTAALELFAAPGSWTSTQRRKAAREALEAAQDGVTVHACNPDPAQGIIP